MRTLFFLFLCTFIFSCKSNTNSTSQEPSNPTPVTQEPSPQDSATQSPPATPTPSEPPKKETTATNNLATLPTWPAKENKEPNKLYPFDEAVQDASLVAFRQMLYKAVLEKDAEFLKGIVHDDIKFSFGAEGGKEQFIESWQFNTKPKESEIWGELKELLELGGGYNRYGKNSFYAPYLFMTDRIEDPYETGAIIGEGVRLRAEQNTSSEIITSLTWDKVKVNYTDNVKYETINGVRDQWVSVTTQDGKKGYVFGQFVRVPVDYRAGFEKDENGNWKMITFIAGD